MPHDNAQNSDDPPLEDTAGIPGAIHTVSPDLEEEAQASKMGTGGAGRGGPGGSSADSEPPAEREFRRS